MSSAKKFDYLLAKSNGRDYLGSAMKNITNLTNLHTISQDSSLIQPIEIHFEGGRAIAVYDGEPDAKYDNIGDLLEDHTIAVDDLIRLLRDRGDDEIAEGLAELAVKEELSAA